MGKIKFYLVPKVVLNRVGGGGGYGPLGPSWIRYCENTVKSNFDTFIERMKYDKS